MAPPDPHLSLLRRFFRPAYRRARSRSDESAGCKVKRRVAEIAKRIEAESGSKPGRNQTKALREQAVLDLLPMAFTKQSAIVVWIDPGRRALVVGASSQVKAAPEEVATALVKVLDGISVSLLQTAWSASALKPPGSYAAARAARAATTSSTHCAAAATPPPPLTSARARSSMSSCGWPRIA